MVECGIKQGGIVVLTEGNQLKNQYQEYEQVSVTDMTMGTIGNEILVSKNNDANVKKRKKV